MYAMQVKINYYTAPGQIQQHKKFSLFNCDPDVKLHIHLNIMF
jgi:hypothetical protein